MMDLVVTSIILPEGGDENIQIPPEAVSIQGANGQALVAKTLSSIESRRQEIDIGQVVLVAVSQASSLLNAPAYNGGQFYPNDYLRRIEGIAFSGLPSSSSTVLTTVLTGSEGAQVCQVPISYRTGAPEYTSLRLIPGGSTPDESRAVTRAGNGSAVPQSALVNALSLSEGQPLLERDIATSQFLLQGHAVNINNVAIGINANAVALGQDNPVVIRVRDFIARVRNGESQQRAAQELGIEWSLTIELDRQGETHQWGLQT